MATDIINKNEDYEIIKQILSGNINKFSIIQNKYYYLIFSLVKKIIKDPDDIEDIIQETFIKAYSKLITYNNDHSFSSWIYKIASNNCIDFIRRKKKLSYDNIIDEYNAEEGFQIEDITFMPDKDIMNTERSKIIKDTIKHLPDRYKLLIKLRYEDELKCEDIATQLNIPLGTVKTHLFRARKIMGLALKKYPEVF